MSITRRRQILRFLPYLFLLVLLAGCSPNPGAESSTPGKEAAPVTTDRTKSK